MPKIVFSLRQAQFLLIAASVKFATVPNGYNRETMEACMKIIEWCQCTGMYEIEVGGDFPRDDKGQIRIASDRYAEYMDEKDGQGEATADRALRS